MNTLTYDEAKTRLDVLNSLDYSEVNQVYRSFEDYQFDKLKLISFLKRFYKSEDE